MDQQEIKHRVRAYIEQRFPLALQLGIGDSDSLIHSGTVDSLGVLDLVAFIQEEFAVTLSDDDLVSESFHTIDRLAGLIEQRMHNDQAVRPEA